MIIWDDTLPAVDDDRDELGPAWSTAVWLWLITGLGVAAAIAAIGLR